MTPLRNSQIIIALTLTILGTWMIGSLSFPSIIITQNDHGHAIHICQCQHATGECTDACACAHPSDTQISHCGTPQDTGSPIAIHPPSSEKSILHHWPTPPLISTHTPLPYSPYRYPLTPTLEVPTPPPRV